MYLGHERLTGQALVVGAEHVSFSAVMTLAHAGAHVVALATEHERQQSYAAFRLGAAVRWRVPVWTSTAVRRVVGRGQLAGVEVDRAGTARFVPCDIVVFTGDWIPDHELARLAGLAPAGWPGSTPRVGRSASSPAEGPSGRRWHPGSLSKASSAARPARIRLHPEP